MIERSIKDKLVYLTSKFPIVTLTGIRQCGKSTLLRNCFADIASLPAESQTVIYGGDFSMTTAQGRYLSWKDLP